MTDRDGAQTTGRGPKRTGRDRTKALGFALVVFVASAVPVPGSSGGTGGALGGVLDALPAGIGVTDPFHLVGYAVLAALLVPAAGGRRSRPLLAAAGAVAFGFGIELVQAPIPWRSFAWDDAAVNAVGAAVGAAVAAVHGAATDDREVGR